MKRVREQKSERKLAEMVNSPPKQVPKRSKEFLGKSALRFNFLPNQPENSEHTVSLFLDWTKKWNAFLISYVWCQLHPENRLYYLYEEDYPIKSSRESLRSLDINKVKQSPHAAVILKALDQCDSFDYHMTIEPVDIAGLGPFYRSLEIYHNHIEGGYKALDLLLAHCERVINDLSASPTFSEYQEMCNDLEKNILPALDDYIENLFCFPASIDKKINALKPTRLKDYLLSILEDKKKQFIVLRDKLNAQRSMISIFIDDIKAEVQDLQEGASALIELREQDCPVQESTESIPHSSFPRGC